MKRLIIILLITGGSLFIGSSTASRSAPATSLTLTVNRTGDGSDLNPGDGLCDASVNVGQQCSLRAAIEELNSQGAGATPHRIEFDIPGTGPFTIAPGSRLPFITVPLEINGETQPGSACPTDENPAELMIILDGSNLLTGDGLYLSVGSDGSTIQGLTIVNFSSGIYFLSHRNHARCNHLDSNIHGILVISTGNTIGGLLAAHRNVISNNYYGIMNLASNNNVLNNFIGTTPEGINARGNTLAGIYLSGNNNLIGGTDPSARNLISGNGDGILISLGRSNTIFGNYIGVAIDGITALPNNLHGIRFRGTSIANRIGGTLAGEANLISHNVRDGVRLSEDFGNFPIQNEIRGNSISNNGGLGIDLGGDGITANDPGDTDGQSNEQQNYPVLSTSQSNTTLTISLDSQPNTLFNVDLYRNDRCDPSRYGEGQQYLNTIQMTTDGFGQANIDINLDGMVSQGDRIASTATDPDGNTSEFSNCVVVFAAQSENYIYLPVIQQ
jgi:CSLREA domain-containing protein